MFLKILGFFLLISSVCEASQLKSNTAESSLFNFTNTNSDKRLSREINSYIRFLKMYRYDSSNLKNINYLLQTTAAFKDLSKTIKWSMKVVSTYPANSQFYKRCKRIPHRSQFEEKLVDLTMNYCNTRFLKTISSAKNRFTSTQLNHIHNNIDILLLKENRNDFSKFLSLIKKDNYNFKLISAYLNNYYVENYEAPAGDILQSININDELTTFIQSNGIDLNTSKKYFTREFINLIKQTRAEIKNNNLVRSEVMFSEALAFFHQNKQYISNVTAWRKLLYTTQDYSSIKEFTRAHNSYKKIFQVCTHEQKDKTLFNMLMNSIRSNDKALLQLTLSSYSYLENFSKHSIKLRFWIARALEKTGDVKTALYLYKKIASNSSLQYYSILASRRISHEKDSKTPEELKPKRMIANVQLNAIKKKSFSIPFQQNLKRLSLWIDLQMDGLIEMESQDILDLSSQDVFKSELLSSQFGKNEFQRLIFKELITLFNQRRNYLQTFKLVYKAIDSRTYDINDKSLEVLFPFRYIDKIEKYSKSIDPLLILALIRQESAFNPDAKSHAGARGLMQLMPATAKRYKRKVKAHQLKDPTLNLRIGIKYLKKLLVQYDGNLIHTLSAYNAGEGRVKRWMKDVFNHHDPLLTIESIPFEETRNYVKLIYRNIYFYKFLTKNLNLATPINDTFLVKI